MSDQQLVARIKRTSKYWGQTEPNQWFDVEVVDWDHAYPLRGNSNNYRMADVTFGVRLAGGMIVDLSKGTITPAGRDWADTRRRA